MSLNLLFRTVGYFNLTYGGVYTAAVFVTSDQTVQFLNLNLLLGLALIIVGALVLALTKKWYKFMPANTAGPTKN